MGIFSRQAPSPQISLEEITHSANALSGSDAEALRGMLNDLLSRTDLQQWQDSNLNFRLLVARANDDATASKNLLVKHALQLVQQRGIKAKYPINHGDELLLSKVNDLCGGNSSISSSLLRNTATTFGLIARKLISEYGSELHELETPKNEVNDFVLEVHVEGADIKNSTSVVLTHENKNSHNVALSALETLASQLLGLTEYSDFRLIFDANNWERQNPVTKPTRSRNDSVVATSYSTSWGSVSFAGTLTIVAKDVTGTESTLKFARRELVVLPIVSQQFFAALQLKSTIDKFLTIDEPIAVVAASEVVTDTPDPVVTTPDPVINEASLTSDTPQS